MAFKSKQVVSWLIAKHPDVVEFGFRKAIRDHVSNEPRVMGTAKGFLPDAFAILHEAREVHAIEVIDTCPVTFDKGARMYEFGEALREIDWTFSVIAFDYTGGLIAHLPSWCFCPTYTDRFKGQEMRDVLPAAMAVYRGDSNDGSSSYGEQRWMKRGI